MEDIILFEQNNIITKQLLRCIQALPIQIRVYTDTAQAPHSRSSLPETPIYLVDLSFDHDAGLSFARLLHDRCPYSIIIFLGTRASYCPDIYQIEHCYFVLLEEMEIWLPTAIEKALKQRDHHKRYLCFYQKNRLIQLHTDDIAYLERRLRVTMIHTENDVYTTGMTLSQCMTQLPNYYAQCHCSFIINLKKVRIYQRNGVFLMHHSFIPISRTYAQDMKKAWVSFHQDNPAFSD